MNQHVHGTFGRSLFARLFFVLSLAAVTIAVISLANNRVAASAEESTFTIVNGGDDARSPDLGGFTSSETTALIGSGDGESPNVNGFRFTDIDIPKGATIEGVDFSMVKASDQWLAMRVELGFEATDDAAAFSAGDAPDGRNMTSATSTVSGDEKYKANQRYELGSSSQLAASLQEVIDRSGWESGNDLALIAYGPASPAWARHDFYTRDAGSSRAPQLTITYSVEDADDSDDSDSASGLVVTGLDFAAVELSSGHRLDADVSVTEDGEPARRAMVRVTFEYPDGSSVGEQKMTDRNGLVEFSKSASGAGEYELIVDGVAKQQAEYNEEASITSATVWIEDEDDATPTEEETPTETATETATETETEEETATETEEETATETEEETATETEEETATETEEETATETHDGDHGSGVECGEPSNRWHPPVVNGCETGHEHGDAPPAWADSFSQEMFGHPVIYGGDEQTSNENRDKHWAFKGYSVEFHDTEIFFRTHMQTNPMGHNARFHSYEIYARDQSGNVSFWQGWLDFGTGNNTLPTVHDEHCEASVRPIMLVNKVDCAPNMFESWYSRAGGTMGDLSSWSWDTGTNVETTFYAGGDPHDMDTWTQTENENLGLNRRVELAWYPDRADYAFSISPAGGYDEVFYATQFGDIVTGPDDSVCGTSRTFGDRTYEVKCLPQYIASTAQEVSFPGNSAQKNYPGEGVQLPN